MHGRSYSALALACACMVVISWTGLAQTAQIVPALVGITQTNGILPCVGDGTTACYGIPAGAVALEPEMFIQPAVPATWYAVFQTGAWSGNLNVTFDLIENKAVVQSATATATAGANSTVLVTVSQSAPSNGYSGGATLQVGTLATPTGGGAPVTLKSAVLVQVGSTSSEVVVALAGFSQYMDEQPSPPCIGSGFCFGVPIDAAVVWPQNITAPVNGIWYSVFQTGTWKGEINRITYKLAEGGTTVMTYGPVNGYVIKANSLLITGVTENFVVPSNGYAGPAVLTTTAVADEAGGLSHTNLKYTAPIQVLPPPAE